MSTHDYVERKNDATILGKLDALQHGQDELKNGQDLMHAELFGKPDEETKHGRIPRLEAKVQRDNERLDKLENMAVRATAIAFFLIVAIESAAHLLNIATIARR